MVLRYLFRWELGSLVVGMIMLLSGCANSLSQDLIQDIAICQQNDDLQCNESTPEFVGFPADLMATADIGNVPVDSLITVEWNYLAENSSTPMPIEAVSYEKVDEQVTTMFAILGQPQNGWPQGNYEVVLSVMDDPATLVRQPFSIFRSEPSSGVSN